MFHYDIKLPGSLEPKHQAKLHLCWKQFIKKVMCLNIPRYFSGSEFKNEVSWLVEKCNIDVRRATTKYKHTPTLFVDVYIKELAKLLYKPLDAQELEDHEKVSTVWVNNLHLNCEQNEQHKIIDD